MRCKGCNNEFQSYTRTVTLESEEKLRLEEDLCATCRKGVYDNFLDNPLNVELELFLSQFADPWGRHAEDFD